MDLLAALGAEIRRRRERLALSQEDLAFKANLHRTYIGSVERGERNLAIRNIFEVARALGCKPSDIIKAVEAHVDAPL